MIRNNINQTPVISRRKPLFLKQFAKVLPSGVGSTEVVTLKSTFTRNTVMHGRSPFYLKQYPKPMPSKIGEEDLPGGFRKENLISGQAQPLYDLARGKIQIDDVKVLFDAKA